MNWRRSPSDFAVRKKLRNCNVHHKLDMQKTKAMRTLFLLWLCCAAVAPSLFLESLYAQPRKRKVIEPTESAPATATKPAKTLDASKLAKQKQQELFKSPEQILNLAISQYQSENYAIAESLLARYASLSQSEPLERREQAQLMQIKTQVKLGKVDAAKEALSRARLDFSSNAIQREADFDAAALEWREGQFFSAAKKFMSIVGASWSPEDENTLARRAAMHLYSLANVFLQRSEVIELLLAAENPTLSALLLDAFSRRELGREQPSIDSLALFASMIETKYATSLTPAYRALLESARQHISLVRRGAARFRVGVLMPFTIDLFNGSEVPSLGEKMMHGVIQAVTTYHQLAVGRRIDLLIRHCATDDSLALRTMLTELIERDSAQIILGPVYSSQAVRVSHFCAEKGVPMLTPTATDDGITRDIPTSFQLNPTYAVRGKAIANFLMEALGAKTFGVLAQDSTYGKFMAEGFRDAVLAAGGDIKFYGILPTKLRGIAEAIAPLKLKAHPKKGFPETAIDAVYIPMSDFEAIAIAVEQLKFYNIKTRVIGSGDWHDPLLLSQYRQIGDSVIYAIDSDVSPDAPETKRVADAFKAQWGIAPNLQFWFGYDAMDFIIAVVVEKGIMARADIARAIRSAPPYRGHRSEIFFGGGNVNLKMNVMKFQNGAITKLQ